FIYRRNGVSQTRHKLSSQLEAQIHALGADVEQQVAWRRDRMARSGTNLPEGMQFCRPWLPEEAVPRVGSKPDDAGKPSLQVTKFHGAHQRGQISAERAHGGAIFRARIESCNQEDRGASKRCGHCLCEGRRSACYFGRVGRIGLHQVPSLVERADFALRKCCAQLACEISPCKLTIGLPRRALVFGGRRGSTLL